MLQRRGRIRKEKLGAGTRGREVPGPGGSEGLTDV